MIHTDLVKLIISIEYDVSKYSLLLTDDATQAITGILLNKKSQVKIELPKYTTRLQTLFNITVQGFRLDNRGKYIDQELQT